MTKRQPQAKTGADLDQKCRRHNQSRAHTALILREQFRDHCRLRIIGAVGTRLTQLGNRNDKRIATCLQLSGFADHLAFANKPDMFGTEGATGRDRRVGALPARCPAAILLGNGHVALDLGREPQHAYTLQLRVDRGKRAHFLIELARLRDAGLDEAAAHLRGKT